MKHTQKIIHMKNIDDIKKNGGEIYGYISAGSHDDLMAYCDTHNLASSDVVTRALAECSTSMPWEGYLDSQFDPAFEEAL